MWNNLNLHKKLMSELGKDNSIQQKYIVPPHASPYTSTVSLVMAAVEHTKPSCTA